MVVPLAAAALAGGLSLAKGLFARADASRARKEAMRAEDANRMAVEQANLKNQALGEAYLREPMVNLKAMVSEAEASGFNPLTILRAGGLSAYSKSQQLPGYQMISPQVFQASPLPTVPGVGTVLADAASDAFSSFMSRTNTLGQQEFQRGLLQMSLDAKGSTKSGKSSSGGKKKSGGGDDEDLSKYLYLPGGATAGGAVKYGGGELGRALGTLPLEIEKPKLTNPHRTLGIDADYLDAQSAEDRYGDFVGAFYGIRNQVGDWMFQATGMNSKQRYEAWGKPALEWVKGLGGFLKTQDHPPLRGSL